MASLDIPYRGNYYGVGICLRGSAEFKVNLETYIIEPRCLLMNPPETITQWASVSNDFETLTIFFTKEFMTAGRHPAGRHPAGRHPAGRHPAGRHPAGRHPAGRHPAGRHPAGRHPAGRHPAGRHPAGRHPAGRHPATNAIYLDNFSFFEIAAQHAFQLSRSQSKDITASLTMLQQRYNTPHAYQNEILKSLIDILLYKIASIYDQHLLASHTQPVQTRSQLLASEFKKLVHSHFLAERSLTFYAQRLFITSKHLTETVKEVTGKTAGQWIADAVILEAKVLLQNPSLTIAQIADALHFADQSTFGKFFKKSTELSPMAYKQSL